MKKIYLSTLAIAAAFSLQAQSSFSLGATDLLIDAPLNSHAYQMTMCTNTAGATVTYRYDLIGHNMPAGWSIQFCDPNACFSNPNMSDVFELARDASGMFKLEVWPNNIPGSASYAVRIYNDSDPNDADTLTWIINAVVGIEDELLDRQVSLFPNPASSHLQLSANQGSLPKGQVNLYDLSGKLVAEQPIAAVADARIDISTLSPGMYVLRFATASGTISRKFIKE